MFWKEIINVLVDEYYLLKMGSDSTSILFLFKIIFL